MSLEETKTSLITASENHERLLTCIKELHMLELRSEDKVLSQALAELHNSEKINLLSSISNLANHSVGSNFVTVSRVFENTLPMLNANVDDVILCIVHLMQQSGKGMIFGGIYNAFQIFCSSDVLRASKSIDLILKQSELGTFATLLSSSVLAYSSKNVADAIKASEILIFHENVIVREQGYFALARVQIEETFSKDIWQLLSSRVYVEHEATCRSVLLRALIHLGSISSYHWVKIEKILPELLKNAEPEILNEISNIVAFDTVDLPDDVFFLLVKELENISAEHIGIINNLEYLLVKLLESTRTATTVRLLESFVISGVALTSLNYFSDELLDKYPDLYSHILTKWFLSGDSSLCHAVFDLLNHSSDDGISLKADSTLLTNELEEIFVVHKAIGWLFTLPIASASFILSIYKNASPATREEIEQNLYDPLLLSYPGMLKNFFRSLIDNEILKPLLERLLKRFYDYSTDLNKLSGLKELSAPRENVDTYWKRFSKDIADAQEQASRSSFLHQIVNTEKILYGNSSIFYVKQGDGNKLRQEVNMHAFSHSSELPTLNVIDPERLDYKLRVYRHRSKK